MKIIKI